MSAPKRIQMSRQKPWRADNPDAVIVARPSKWGNPFTIAGAIEHGYADTHAEGRTVAVDAYRDWLHGDSWAAGGGPEWTVNRLRILADLGDLTGKDLACWCPSGFSCHADVLLEEANK